MGRGARRSRLRHGRALSEAISVTVVGGYLGAGKTTLVNHLLRHAAGLRIAVLVNDFGELPIDADLIQSRDGDVLSIAGGCICCSFGSDLLAALMQLPQRTPAPQHVLVETSGVALPAAVARSVALLPAFRREATVVLADAETVRARAADRYVGDTVTRQLAEADLIVVSKCDLVTPDALNLLLPWLQGQAPRARLIQAQRGEVPLELLLGVAAGGAAAAAAGWLQSGGIRSRGALHAQQRFESVAFRPAQALEVARLGASLADPALGVLRAKGILRDRDGSWKALHVVGSRWEVSAAQAEMRSAALVCIGVAGEMQTRAIENAIAQAASCA